MVQIVNSCQNRLISVRLTQIAIPWKKQDDFSEDGLNCQLMQKQADLSEIDSNRHLRQKQDGISEIKSDCQQIKKQADLSEIDSIS